MRLFEYCQERVMNTLNDDQKRFVGKIIMRDIHRIAKEFPEMDEQTIYWGYSRGLYGSDREVNY